jgi:signal peptide peptidase SppA
MTAFKVILYISGSLLVLYFAFSWYKDWEMQKAFIPPFYDDGYCNVAIVPVGGEIGIGNTFAVPGETGYSATSISPLGDVDRIIYDLNYIKNSPQILAVILQVDSYGGGVSAAETLYNYLNGFKEKPIVTLFRDAGVSAGYMIALPTERIFAGRTTGVGSIGVTMSTLNNYEKNKKEGIEYVEITSGRFKDGLSPDKKLDKEILQYEQDEIDKLARIFVDLVSLHRRIPLDVVKSLADGRVWIGEDAFKLGLIDEVGTLDNTLAYLKSKTGGQVEMIPCVIPKY